MSVHCRECGEELLGAVNRCWKCGQLYAETPSEDGKPPVRGVTPEDTETAWRDDVAQPRGPSAFASVRDSCALASIVVGFFSLCSLPLTTWAGLTAMLGLLMGLVGLGSSKRLAAIVGISLNCLVVGIALVLAGLWLTEYRRIQEQYLEDGIF